MDACPSSIAVEQVRQQNTHFPPTYGLTLCLQHSPFLFLLLYHGGLLLHGGQSSGTFFPFQVKFISTEEGKKRKPNQTNQVTD